MNKDNYIHMPYNDEWIAQRADPFILRAANDLGGLVHAEEKTLWVRHESGPQSIHIWAPEIHYLFGGWYIYYAAGDKDDIWNIRPYVLHCKGQNPMKDEWEELGMMQAADSDEFSFHAFSLDATVVLYLGGKNGCRSPDFQSVYRKNGSSQQTLHGSGIVDNTGL